MTAAGRPHRQELAQFSLRQEELPCTVFAAPHPTRVNLKILSRKDGLTTELNAVGALGDAACAERLENGELLERLLPGDTVVFCGSLPQVVPAGWYRECITACREKGAAVFLDASGEPLILGISAKPDCIKPNREELELLYGYACSGPRTLRKRHGSCCTAAWNRWWFPWEPRGPCLPARTRFYLWRRPHAVNAKHRRRGHHDGGFNIRAPSRADP